MKHLILLLIPIALFTGCASPSKVATSKLKFTLPVQGGGTRTAEITTPKDISFDSLTVNPQTGEVSIHGYKSVVDAGAVAATVAAQQAQSQAGADMLATVKLLAEGYAKSQGVPLPQQQAQPAPYSGPVPMPAYPPPTLVYPLSTNVVYAPNGTWIPNGGGK